MSGVKPEPAAAQMAAPGSMTASQPRAPSPVTVRALVLAVLLTLLAAAWTKQAELVSLTSQISESTPPIAAILCLFLLPAVGAVLLRLAAALQGRGRLRLAELCRRARLSQGEMLVVFVFVAITAAMPGVGLFRQVMPCLMVTQYFGQPADHLDAMALAIPEWLAPTDPEVARVFWEGSDRAAPTLGAESIPVLGPLLAPVVRFLAGAALIPWRHWLVPFALWSAYLSIYLIAAFCLVMMYRRAWEEDEHLNFPVSNLPVETIDPERSRFGQTGFFRDPVVWTGLLLAFAYNASNALHVFNPGLPALGISYPLGQLFTESPWDTMRGLAIYYKPEMLGLGYLVPSDALFSIWLFTLLAWFVRPLARVVGYTPAGFPFITQQAMGAFVVLGVGFTWQARHRLAQALRRALAGGAGGDASQEPLSFRWMVLGALLGIAAVIGMPVAFGVVPWVALMYFGIMLLVLVVYARNRAEMGFPIVWGYPLYQERASMVELLGSEAFVRPGFLQSFTVLTMFSWLQRSVNQAMTSTAQEGTVAAHRLGQPRRAIARVVIGAILFGVPVAFLLNLAAFYEYGGLVLSSPGAVTGGQMTQEVLGQFRRVSEWVDKPVGPDGQKIGYTLLGGALALGMLLGRRAWPRFPLHAGGYALAFCHQGPYMWFPALLLWGIKRLTLQLGGAGLYRRLARGFLAFTLGHFFSVGIWSLVGLAAGEWVRRYIVWFL
ncbi:MAG: DUF6785 family protein [Armatimonadota bacterium]